MTQSTMISSGAITDPNQALLLQQLIDNPSLRSELEADPIATLGRFGIELDPSSVPETVQLPSASQLDQSLAARTLKWFPFFA